MNSKINAPIANLLSHNNATQRSTAYIEKTTDISSAQQGLLIWKSKKKTL